MHELSELACFVIGSALIPFYLHAGKNILLPQMLLFFRWSICIAWDQLQGGGFVKVVK